MASSENRTIVLTGCTRGLGRALLWEFAAHGHTVIGCGRNRAAVDLLRQEFGAPHHFAVVDLSDPVSVADWAEVVLRTSGTPDLLINNAAVAHEPAPLQQVSEAELTRLFEINVNGTIRTIRAFLPAMADRGSGVIVNMSSGSGRTGLPHIAPYCASKWAIEGLTKALHAELPDGLATVALSPGVVDTAMLRQVWGDRAATAPDPEAWAKRAVPFILALGPEQSGQSLTTPEPSPD